jgi:hypothetical protein
LKALLQALRKINRETEGILANQDSDHAKSLLQRLTALKKTKKDKEVEDEEQKNGSVIESSIADFMDQLESLVSEIHKGRVEVTTAMRLMQTARQCARNLLHNGKITQTDTV